MTVTDLDANRDKYCGGKKRGPEGGNCTRPAGWGSPHPGVGRCKLHGGSAPSSVAAARVVMAERAVKTFGLPVTGVPASVALLDEFGWILGHVTWLRERVQESDPDALIWGKQSEDHKLAGEFPGVDTRFLASPSVWLELYHRYHRLLLDYAKVIETLKLDQARLDLAKAMGDKFASRIQIFVGALQLSPDQVALVPQALAAMRAELTAEVAL